MKNKFDLTHRIVAYLLDSLNVNPLERGVDIQPYVSEPLKDIEVDDIYNFFNKLISDYKVASEMFSPPQYDTSGEDPYMFSIDDPLNNTFTIVLTDRFEEWATNYLKQPDNLYPLQIDFTPNREIILNGYFLLGKPDFDSENELVFGYLFKNPNTRTSQEDIEKALNIKINKSFHKIIENLGFKGDLKHIFFQVSKNTILFRNPVTPEELNKLGYSRIKLS